MATKDKEVAVVEKKMYPLVEKALSFKSIEGEADMEAANILLSTMKDIAKQAEEKKERIIGPAKAIVKEQNSIYKPFEDRYKQGIEYMRGLMGAYQTKMIAAAKIKEDKIANRIAPGKGNLSIEKGMEKMAEVERPQKVVSSSVGTTKFKPHPKVTIVPLHKALDSDKAYRNDQQHFAFQISKFIDMGLIVWDEVAVRKLVIAEKKSELPGVTFEIVQIPVNSNNY